MPVIPLVPLNSLSTVEVPACPAPYAADAAAAVMAWLLMLEEMPPIEFGTKADMDVRPVPGACAVVADRLDTTPPGALLPLGRLEVRADE